MEMRHSVKQSAKIRHPHGMLWFFFWGEATKESPSSQNTTQRLNNPFSSSLEALLSTSDKMKLKLIRGELFCLSSLCVVCIFSGSYFCQVSQWTQFRNYFRLMVCFVLWQSDKQRQQAAKAAFQRNSGPKNVCVELCGKTFVIYVEKYRAILFILCKYFRCCPHGARASPPSWTSTRRIFAVNE